MSEEPIPVMPNNESVSHWIRWKDDKATFTCNGTSSSPCHNFPDCECEEWSEEHGRYQAEHSIVSHEKACWVLTWLDNIDPNDTYGDSETPLSELPQHDARIEWEWSGDGVSWIYADLELNTATVVELTQADA